MAIGGGTVIIVTGASRGIGQAIASRFAGQGIEVVGIARTLTKQTFPMFSCDVSDYVAMKELSAKLYRDGFRVRSLINAAGVASLNLSLMTRPERVRSVVETNLLGTIYACNVFAPQMVRQKQGRIINFSSIAAKLATPGEAVYASSKAGVETFSRVLARELSAFGITVNSVAPGPVDTDLLRGVTSSQISDLVERQIIRRQFSKDEVCDVIELIMDQRAQSITGQTFHIGGA